MLRNVCKEQQKMNSPWNFVYAQKLIEKKNKLSPQLRAPIQQLTVWKVNQLMRYVSCDSEYCSGHFNIFDILIQWSSQFLCNCINEKKKNITEYSTKERQQHPFEFNIDAQNILPFYKQATVKWRQQYIEVSDRFSMS